MCLHYPELMVLERGPCPFGLGLVGVHRVGSVGEGCSLHEPVHRSKVGIHRDLALLPPPPLLQHGLVVVVIELALRRATAGAHRREIARWTAVGKPLVSWVPIWRVRSWWRETAVRELPAQLRRRLLGHGGIGDHARLHVVRVHMVVL